MSEETFNVARAAYLLGINESQVYALVKFKKIPFFRHGYSLRFKKEVLEEWATKEAIKKDKYIRNKNFYSELKNELRKLSRSPIAKKHIIDKMQEVINQMKVLTEEEK